MPFVGMSPGQIKLAAQHMISKAEELAALESRIDRLIAEARNHWHGPDLEAFAYRWSCGDRVRMATAIRHVREQASALERQAAAQLDASAADGSLPARPFVPAGVNPGGRLPGDGLPLSSAGGVQLDTEGSPFGGNPFNQEGQNPFGDTENAVDWRIPPPKPTPEVPSNPPAPLDGFSMGNPSKPHIPWDEDYVWGSEDANFGDGLNWALWQGAAVAGRMKGLDDAVDMYDHYRGNTGNPASFDYEEACDEDKSIKKNVDTEIARIKAAADAYAQAGYSSFPMVGEPRESIVYPETENWQKAIGGYQQWSSANVWVEGDKVTMVVTVHAEDHYNFNSGQSDIASGVPDDANGRFTSIGWAKPFDSSGSVTRTVTWTVGDPGQAVIGGGESDHSER